MFVNGRNIMMGAVILFILIELSIAASSSQSDVKPTPIVLWHGMGDTCCFSFSLGAVTKLLESEIPGVYVKSLQIGNTTIEDLENGYFMTPNNQIKNACRQISKDPLLKNGFNAIGFSQGSQFLRGLVQRCGHRLPPIKNLISLGGQHQGVYGLPNCGALQHHTCDYVRKLLNYAAYYSWVQSSLAQATYWHDPLDEDTYKTKSQFLADINNERTVNPSYISNLNNVEHFVLVRFDHDTIVQPVDTEWFGYYAPGQTGETVKLQDSDIYLKDRLGLKKMDEDGKLVFLSTPGNHLKFSEEWFINNIVNTYLRS